MASSGAAVAPKFVKGKIVSGRTLLGEGDAFVAGLPSDFVLTEVLKKAERIRLATAFAHLSGWRHFKKGVTDGRSLVFLLTGLEYCQTEPALLKKWLRLQSREPKRIEAKLTSRRPFFHPKVLIVTFANKQDDFAIVGPGNLSQGGVRNNTECSVYVQDVELINQLTHWFESKFDRASLLNEAAIKKYEPYYKRNLKRQRQLQKEQNSAEKEIGSAIWHWEKALREAKKYFGSPNFDERYQSRKHGRDRILTALKYPDFTFDREGFRDFFSIGSFGTLNPLNRNKIFRSAKRIKSGLRILLVSRHCDKPIFCSQQGRKILRSWLQAECCYQVLGST
jgi:hypothetical protein